MSINFVITPLDLVLLGLGVFAVGTLSLITIASRR